MKFHWLIVGLLLAVVGCRAPVDGADWRGPPGSTTPNAAGLVSLPCDGSTGLAPAKPYYCRVGRHFLTPQARAVMLEAASSIARRHPGSPLYFMDASGPDGVKPFPPHLSHGDGRQLDVALFYTDTAGTPLNRFPDTSRHGGYWPAEPPRPGEDTACPDGRAQEAEKPDPPANRPWRLDETRTRAVLDILLADPRVRRILIEPHLERRLGLWGHPKLRFAGCQAARHDDHMHIDFF